MPHHLSGHQISRTGPSSRTSAPRNAPSLVLEVWSFFGAWCLDFGAFRASLLPVRPLHLHRGLAAETVPIAHIPVLHTKLVDHLRHLHVKTAVFRDLPDLPLPPPA